MKLPLLLAHRIHRRPEAGNARRPQAGLVQPEVLPVRGRMPAVVHDSERSAECSSGEASYFADVDHAPPSELLIRIE